MKGIKSLARQEQMFELVRQYLKGTKSISGICSEYRMCPTSLRYWIRKYKSVAGETLENNSNGNFIPLQFINDLKDLEGKLEILYPNGVGMRVPINTDAQRIKTFITIF